MAVGHPDFRVGPVRLFAADEQREHPRDVSLERKYLQLEHQPRVFVERARDVGRPLGQVERRLSRVLGVLNARLEGAHRIEILGDARAV